MPRLRWLFALLVVALLAPSAHAQQRSERARTAFYEGRKAYEANDYAKAYDLFKQSYILSQEPALLYNIAAVLQAMERPGDAAKALRDYLVQAPNDPEKPQLERRIASLEHAQILMDRDKAVAKAETIKPQQATPPSDAQRFAAEQAAREAETRRQLDLLRTELVSQRSRDTELIGRLNTQLEVDRKKRRNLAIGLSIGGVLVVGAAVGLAIFFTREPKDTATPADIGPITATE